MIAQQHTPQEDSQMPPAPESGEQVSFPKLQTEQAKASRDRVSDLIAGSLAGESLETRGTSPLIENNELTADMKKPNREPFGRADDLDKNKATRVASPNIVKAGQAALPTTALDNLTDEEIVSTIDNAIPNGDSEGTSAA